MPGVRKEEAYQVAEKIREVVFNEPILRDHTKVSISLGIAGFPDDGQSYAEIYGCADKALYHAKKTGRNKSVKWASQIPHEERRATPLDGIVGGSELENSRRILAMVELIRTMNEDGVCQDQIFDFLGRVIDTLHAQKGILFLVQDAKVINTYGRERNKHTWLADPAYNQKILEETLKTKQGSTLIDWEGALNQDVLMGLPVWDSVLVVPAIKRGELKAVLYLVSPIRSKEFNADDYNLASVFMDIFNLIDVGGLA